MQIMQCGTGPDVAPVGIWGDETEVVAATMDWAANRVVRHTDPKTTARRSSELAAAVGKTITAEGIGGAAALRIFGEVLDPATRAQDDPMNLAYIPAAPTRAGVAFDSVTSAANIFGGLWEAGAGAIFAENQALAWLVELLGWPETAGGCFVSGGTIGNLSALVTARNAALTKNQGVRPADGWKLACTADAHSSIRSAARVMDVEVVEVPESRAGHLTGAAVAATLAATPGVFAVVASAGTTNTGVVDDLRSIADVCTENDVWLHVDGAYGGAALAAPSVRHLFDGIEFADSFIVDPHKWLFAPYDCCALIYRDPDLARAAHSQRASYLDTVDREAWNPADLAVHLTRRARGLPFWFSLATHGTAKYTEAVERTLSTARQVSAAIDGMDHLRLLLAPELSVLLFDRPGWSDDQHRSWSQQLSQAGVLLCLPTTWNNRLVLRLAFVNPETDPQQVIDILQTTMREQ